MAGSDRAEAVASGHRAPGPRPGGLLPRLPPVLLGVVALALGLWAGLDRLAWTLPVPSAALLEAHGPLMISGVLATLIGVERAVGLQRPILLLVPSVGGLGAILVAFGQIQVGEAAVVIASAGLTAMFAEILRRQPAMYSIVQLAGAACLLGGNLDWALGSAGIPGLVPWWMSFLVLVIGGERLELSRLLRLTPTARVSFALTSVILPIACLLSLGDLSLGYRALGLGLLAWALWLGLFDIARWTLFSHGAPRFMAVALLSGYVWLDLGGAFALTVAPVAEGLLYDATLHMVFLGFVLSMVFAHSLVILPSVLRQPVPFRWPFYVPLALLHLSLAVRVGGDLAGDWHLQSWGGLLNAIAIAAFAVVLVGTVLGHRLQRARTVGPTGLIPPAA